MSAAEPATYAELHAEIGRLRDLVAEICDAMDSGGPYWVDRWRERAGINL